MSQKQDQQQRINLIHTLQQKEIPSHVGVIMDGNGRWAQARGLARSSGHRAGVERVRSVLRFSSDLGIKALSVYAFSSENWKRPSWEIRALMSLLIEFMEKEIDELDSEKVRITFMGNQERLSDTVQSTIQRAKERTKDNDGLIFNIALNYGSRDEITNASRNLCSAVLRGEIDLREIDEYIFSKYLDSAPLPDIDLLIRTSGEQRLSNFMLWQAAYAELVFVNDYWPDFDDYKYASAIRQFQNRHRRFGGLSNDLVKE